MSEEAKVGLADEAIAIVSSGQKDRVNRWERFCKNLGTRQRQQRRLQWLFRWVRYWWIVQLIEIHWNIICAHLLRRAFFCSVCSPRPATLAFVSFFVFPILPDQLQENPSYRKIFSPPWAHCETQGVFWRFTRKFHRELMVVSWRRLWAEFVCEARDFS